MKKRILFVDDEPAVLASLEKLLRRDRARWEMVFALGGQRALDELRRGTFDAVVSDMRMPGIDGAALLIASQRESPATARILLTGYANGADINRALLALHELLDKPCSAAVLRDAIERNLERCADDNEETRDEVLAANLAAPRDDGT
jgi:DNA-binding NtrC family response regulator